LQRKEIKYLAQSPGTNRENYHRHNAENNANPPPGFLSQGSAASGRQSEEKDSQQTEEDRDERRN